MPLGLQEHKVSTSGQPSEPESSPSFGQDTFCQSKADRLNPNCLDSSTHHHFAEVRGAGGALLEQSCPRSLMFSSSYKCYTRTGVPKAPSGLAPKRAQDSTAAQLPSSPWGLQ